jgi:hypothetical protein
VKSAAKGRPARVTNHSHTDANIGQDLRKALVADMLSLWRARGGEILEKLLDEKPEALLRLLGSFVPKEDKEPEDTFSGMSDDELSTEIETLIRARASRTSRSMLAGGSPKTRKK